MDLLDVVVQVEVEISRIADVLGIGVGLSADDIMDRGGDKLHMTDLDRSKNNMGIFGEYIIVFSTNVWLFANIFGKKQTCV